jgi:hypothetical protein
VTAARTGYPADPEPGHSSRSACLTWWQRGYADGYAAGRRDQAASDMGVIAAALRSEAARRQRELLEQLIGVLASAMLAGEREVP